MSEFFTEADSGGVGSLSDAQWIGALRGSVCCIFLLVHKVFLAGCLAPALAVASGSARACAHLHDGSGGWVGVGVVRVLIHDLKQLFLQFASLFSGYLYACIHLLEHALYE